MGLYTVKINERSASGKALLDYLTALNIRLQVLPKEQSRKSSYERSMDDIRNGQVESFASADDMCKALGI